MSPREMRSVPCFPVGAGVLGLKSKLVYAP